MEPSVERKLTTILCADVYGYTRLMEQDEAATLATLKLYRDAINGLIARHRGRVVSTAGDSLLADFQSVVEAVRCAIEIQQELAGRNGSLPDARRMAFRIGINLGDVMLDGGDLYGEGVNVAARLEALAEPGGICISRSVYDQVRNKLTSASTIWATSRSRTSPSRCRCLPCGSTAVPARAGAGAPRGRARSPSSRPITSGSTGSAGARFGQASSWRPCS
jgi:adenylate cyclase